MDLKQFEGLTDDQLLVCLEALTPAEQADLGSTVEFELAVLFSTLNEISKFDKLLRLNFPFITAGLIGIVLQTGYPTNADAALLSDRLMKLGCLAERFSNLIADYQYFKNQLKENQ